jgi:hypothetical protein
MRGALTTAGVHRALGYNDYGELGNGTTSIVPLPVYWDMV